MTEKWAAIPGYSDFMEASTYGRIRYLPAKRGGQKRAGGIYSPFIGKHGYLLIAPKFGGTRKKLLVHRLVASTFVSGEFPDATVNHKDGNKLNNHITNLEWLSRAENTQHQWASGLVDIRGENHPSSKLSDEEAETIRLMPSCHVASVAKEYGVSISLIYKIRAGLKRN